MKTKDISKVCESLKTMAGSHKHIPMGRNASQVTGWRQVTPNTKSPWVSVEIECFISKRWDDIYAVVARAIADIGLHKFVRVKDDGSINPPYSESYACGMEVVVSAPESKILDVLEKVCAVLNELGAKTNDSCGLHIHVDHRPVLKRNALASYNNLFYAEDMLFKVSKPSRRRNEFCTPMNRGKTDPLSAFVYGGGYEERYRSINLSAMECHNTIEIRAFHGTTNFNEIKHFIGLVLGVVNSKTMLSKKLSPKNLGVCPGIPESTRKFIKLKCKKSSKRKAA